MLKHASRLSDMRSKSIAGLKKGTILQGTKKENQENRENPLLSSPSSVGSGLVLISALSFKRRWH
jgi:hypothetical protein